MSAKLQIFAVAKFLHKSILVYFQIFVVSGQGKHAALSGTTHFFIGYLESVKHPLNKKLRIFLESENRQEICIYISV